MTVEQAELIVIGGGPAGMAAALEAHGAGVSVTIMEERPALGGQIFKRIGSGFSVADRARAGHEQRAGQAMIDAVGRSSIGTSMGTVVWGVWDKQVAFMTEEDGAGLIEAQSIILAPGARDRPVVFPGWTLPGVLTAGAAKSLIATQLVLPGRRILMAGSGPLALAFAAQLLSYGADVIEVVEAAASPRTSALARLVAAADPAVLLEAARYRARLIRHRVPFRYSTVVVRAEGRTEVESAIVANVDRDWRVIKGTERRIEVDAILLGYGLESSTELSRICGCEHRYVPSLGGWVPVRDEWMRTSVPGILAAGDGSGVAGYRAAILEGRLAGIAAAHDLGYLSSSQADDRARWIWRRLRRMERFGRALGQIYPMKSGLYELATDATVVCRCEEVTSGRLDEVIADGAIDPNVIRALTRAGMGRCQGRYCASHIAATIARRTGLAIGQVELATVRPPVKPVMVQAIASERVQHEVVADLD